MFYGPHFFIKATGKGLMILLLYVDDMLITGPKMKVINKLKE